MSREISVANFFGFDEIFLTLDTLPSTEGLNLIDCHFTRQSVSGTSNATRNYSQQDRSNEVNSDAVMGALASMHLERTGVRLTFTDRVARGSLGAVYHASLTDSGSPSLVVKLVTGEQNIFLLQHEAHIYDQARHLQGHVIPHCYGLYKNEAGGAACIVLEDCGRPFQKPFEKLSGDTKLAVMQTFKQLHEGGIEHGDPQPWNVLDHNGAPKIVDLHLAMAHECPATRKMMSEEFCFKEAVAELLCDELITIGDCMKFSSQEGSSEPST